MKREKWIDISKGFAILLVVLGHAIRDDMRVDGGLLDWIYRACYIFHMSFFIWLSGYTYAIGENKLFYGETNPFLFVRKRAKRLMIPWVLYSLFIFVIFRMAMLIEPIKRILNSAGYDSLSLGDYALLSLKAQNPWSIHLWFIYILFFISILVYLMQLLSIRKREVALYVTLFVTLLGGTLCKTIGFGTINKVMTYICLYTPFYILGILYNHYQEKFKPRVIIVGTFFSAIYIFVRIKWFSGFSGNTISTDSIVLKMTIYYIAYILLPFLMIGITWIAKRLEERSAGVALNYVGEKSFFIYLFHQPFCCAFLGTVLYSKLKVPSVLSITICFIVSIIVSVVVFYIFNWITNNHKTVVETEK